MPKISVTRSTIIDAPIEKVFSTLNDFSTWTSWSPWLIMDPEAKVTFAEDKKSYEWEGPRSGAGNMKIVGEEEKWGAGGGCGGGGCGGLKALVAGKELFSGFPYVAL